MRVSERVPRPRTGLYVDARVELVVAVAAVGFNKFSGLCYLARDANAKLDSQPLQHKTRNIKRIFACE